MKRPLFTVLLSATFLLTAGAASGWAGTITFNNSSIQPDAALTTTLPEGMASEPDMLPLLGITASGTCDESFGCVSQDAQGENSNEGGSGYTPPSGFVPMGFAPASFDTTTEPDFPPATLGLGPTTNDDGNPALVVQFAGFSAPVDQPVVDGPTLNDTVVTQDLAPAAVPESGSLILVGFGLITGAKYLRRRTLA
jgi:hypothetical protein